MAVTKSNRIFGEIEGYPEGSAFISRAELSRAGVHGPTVRGISGSQYEGADSIVLSGGYSDDDLGDTIIYTGQGGRKPNSREIIEDQKLSDQNLALVISKEKGFPIRVIRGSENPSSFSPQSGYRYDGLYIIQDYWSEFSNNFLVYKFKLTKIPSNIFVSNKPEDSIDDNKILTGVNTGTSTVRKSFQTFRIIRDTKKSNEVKILYNYKCQVCLTRLVGGSGLPYAEAAHIKPLGNPHDGPDDQDNILCLCPNHHVLFDNYAFSIADNYDLIGIGGNLFVQVKHNVNKEYLAYRREQYNKNKI